MSGSKDKNGAPNRSGKEKDSKSEKKEKETSFPSHSAQGVRIKLPPSTNPRQRFICPTCGNSYSKDEDLKEHIADVHRRPRYACEQCRQKFKRPTELARHRVEMHTLKHIMLAESEPETPAKRSLLSLGDSVDSSSENVLSDIHRIGHACRVCGLAFSTREILQNHYRTIHKK